MDNFAAVIRSLLARIRALETSPPGSPRSPVAASDESSRYRVPLTMWGVAPLDDTPPSEPSDTTTSTRTISTPARRRRQLEVPVFRLPVPRGLPAT